MKEHDGADRGAADGLGVGEIDDGKDQGDTGIDTTVREKVSVASYVTDTDSRNEVRDSSADGPDEVFREVCAGDGTAAAGGAKEMFQMFRDTKRPRVNLCEGDNITDHLRSNVCAGAIAGVENSISSEDESEPGLEKPYIRARVTRASKKKFSARGLKCKVLRLLHRGGKDSVCNLEKVYPGDKADGEKNDVHLRESSDDDDYSYMTRRNDQRKSHTFPDNVSTQSFEFISIIPSGFFLCQ